MCKAFLKKKNYILNSAFSHIINYVFFKEIHIFMTSQLSIHQRILNHAFHKNIKQHLRTVFKIENNKKGFLSSKYKKKDKNRKFYFDITKLHF